MIVTRRGDAGTSCQAGPLCNSKANSATQGGSQPEKSFISESLHVPLNRLTLWDGNVRKTDVRAGLDELAASIAAHGLLQSLVVRKGKRGKYEIVARQRRFLALQSLPSSASIMMPTETMGLVILAI
ncbi:MAG: ParB/RepB/Spo0J family partition protein [Hyphomicrobiaceae bacterium]